MFNKISLYLAAIKTRLIYKLYLKECGKSALIIKPLYITFKHLVIGNNVFIRNNARIEGVSQYGDDHYSPLIVIMDNVGIEQNIHLTCAKKITIGKNTAIAANVTITDINHGYEDISLPPEKQPLEVSEVVIGENCKIFNNAVILPGTHLGKHTIVAANSVVSGVFPDFCVLSGVPARIIRKYNFETKRW